MSTLLTNARIWTDGRIAASALRIEGDRITWIGDDPQPVESDEVIDLDGAWLGPGFIDAHTHPAMLSTLVDYADLLPPAVTSIRELQDALRAGPATSVPEVGETSGAGTGGAAGPGTSVPEVGETSGDGTGGAGAGEWILGFGYDESAYPEGRRPNRHDLDAVSDTRPVLAQRCDGHGMVVNSVALAMAGITRDTPEPAGGTIGRDENGEPDGYLSELSATELVTSCLPPVSPARRVEQAAALAAHFAARGIVGVGDLMATWIPEPLATFRAAAETAALPQITLYLGWTHIQHDPPELSEDERCGRIRIGGVKVFADGAYSNRTAWTHDPYPGSCSHGLSTSTDAEILAALDWARRNRVQLAVHAMGDAALDQVIGLTEDLEPWMGELPSVRLDHCTLFSPERIARVARARMDYAIISHTIFFFAEYGSYEKSLSAEQFDIAYPIRSFYEHIPATALASDCPATAWADADDVMTSVQASVTRRSHTGADLGQAEALGVDATLELYTNRAARCLPLDGLGSLRPGAEASFVILASDPAEVPAADLSAVTIRETWLAGRRVYRAQG